MRVGSLFSGYGGLDMAVERYFGATTAWHVEFDKHPSAILAHHWPDVPNYGDVTAVDWETVPPVDIITGGYPCQPFSQAGQRRGTNDDRHLWPYMLDAIRVLRPRIVVAENVAGHLTLGFDTVLADLAAVGFDADWGVVSAAEAGAPHRRERLFIVATDADHGRRGQRLRAGERVAAVAGDCGRAWPQDGDPDGLTCKRGHEFTEENTYWIRPGARACRACRARQDKIQKQRKRGVPDDEIVLLPTPVTNDMGRGKTVDEWDAWTDAMRTRHGNGNGHGKSLEIEALRLLPTPTAQDGANNGGPSQYDRNSLPLNAIATTDFGPYAAAIARWEAATGTPAPAPTEPGNNGRLRLSPRFVEWMMGLPAGHVTGVGIPRSAQLKALGNGVVPAQAALALSLLLPRLYGGEAGAVAVADDVRLLPTPTASLAGGEPAPWKPGVQWWRQSRATRNLAGIVTGNTPEWEGGSA